MKAGKVEVRERWVKAVQVVLEEVGLCPSDPKLRLGPLPTDDSQAGRATEITIQGRRATDDPVGIVAVRGEFRGDSLSTSIFCAASARQDTETVVSSPYLRGHWRIPIDRLTEALVDTLLEREAVLRYLEAGKSPPFHFSRGETGVAIWR